MWSWKVRAALAAAVGLAAPHVEIALKCRAPSPVSGVTSEACLWSRAYLPLTIPLYLIVCGLGVFVALTLGTHLLRQMRE